MRAGSRLATRLNASWVVVHVALEGVAESAAEKVRCVDDAFRLAERLGAETCAWRPRIRSRKSCATLIAKTSPRSCSAVRADHIGDD